MVRYFIYLLRPPASVLSSTSHPIPSPLFLSITSSIPPTHHPPPLPNQAHPLSNICPEIRAALAASMPALLITRPGNAPLSETDKADQDIKIISSLEDVKGLAPDGQVKK